MPTFEEFFEMVLADNARQAANWAELQALAMKACVQLEVSRQQLLEMQAIHRASGATPIPPSLPEAPSREPHGASTPSSPASDAPQSPNGKPRSFKAPKVRGRAAQAILDALAEAGAAGLSGAEVNAAVMAAQLSKDSSEKAKTALKKLNLIRHDLVAQHWYALDTHELKLRDRSIAKNAKKQTGKL